ncbi:hypothetical protein KC336_g57 [Hortaea werneckii]|nr:hypothetical protein KC336_g57 [Hortaea werneckii]
MTLVSEFARPQAELGSAKACIPAALTGSRPTSPHQCRRVMAGWRGCRSMARAPEKAVVGVVSWTPLSASWLDSAPLVPFLDDPFSSPLQWDPGAVRLSLAFRRHCDRTSTVSLAFARSICRLGDALKYTSLGTRSRSVRNLLVSSLLWKSCSAGRSF